MSLGSCACSFSPPYYFSFVSEFFLMKIHSQIRNENAPVRLGLRLHKFGRIESTIIPRRIYLQSSPPIRQISHFYVSTLLS
jgi:hypothetical protein